MRRRRERGKEVASLPLEAVERHEVVVEERKVVTGVSVEEIWKDYITTQQLLEIAEAVGNEFKAEMLRERLQMLKEELKDAVLDENLVEDLRGWC